MRGIVEAVADSIESEVSEASGWDIYKHDPLWRKPREKPSLFVYGTTRRPASFEPGYRTTGSRRDAFEIIVEYVESATDQAKAFERQEEPELAAYEVADSLTEWGDSHSSLGSGDDTFDFDWIETRYTPDVAREFLVRYCRLTFQARRATPLGA